MREKRILHLKKRNHRDFSTKLTLCNKPGITTNNPKEGFVTESDTFLSYNTADWNVMYDYTLCEKCKDLCVFLLLNKEAT